MRAPEQEKGVCSSHQAVPGVPAGMQAFADEGSQNGALCGVLFRLCRLQAGDMDLLLKGLPWPAEGLA